MDNESDVNLDASANELKKNIGKVVISMNEDMLALQQVYKKAKGMKELDGKDAELESRVKKSQKSLEKTLNELDAQPAYVQSEGLEKSLKLMKTTLDTSKILFDPKGYEKLSEEELKKTKENAKISLTEVMKKEKQVKKAFDELSKTLSTLVVDEDTVANLEVELSLLSTPKRERYKKVEKILKKHMQDQTKK